MRLDVAGLGLLAPALAGILLGFSNLSSDGGHVSVLVPLLAGIALLAAFVARSRRPAARNPVVDVRLLRTRSRRDRRRRPPVPARDGTAAAAFRGAFWWSIGITGVALVPALALPVAARD